MKRNGLIKFNSRRRSFQSAERANFSVNTTAGVITVLGTQFNVRTQNFFEALL
jgi:ferric-dicitrate binding protein FerR (iron transport regulator)